MKAKQHEVSTMRLSRSERRELLIEAIVTFGIILFLYLGVVLLYRELIDRPFVFLGETKSLQERLEISPATTQALLYGSMVVTFIFGFLVTNWRVQRRIQQMQLAHILEELKYIAKGNYEHRLSEVDRGEMNEVITSINHLVDSTVEAMEEERRIEKTKDELVTNIGHDIRTPLTSIIGYLGLIENQQYKSIEEVLEYTHIAYTKALHMQTLVNDLFDYTALRQTTYQLQPQAIRLDLFLAQLVADFELEASEKEITVNIQVKPSDLVAYLDVDKMARVFHNLMSNALKYGKGASVIELLAYKKNHKTSSEKGQDVVEFEVRNNGEAIPEAELDMIFERSYRADRSRTAEQLGSGLGLAIVKNIVELHQGTVLAENVDGFVVFRITLPQ
ncbi:HAMP domain-containing histidine kinase [Aerococcaceae bacterium NML210727]|nr:HAMP domain-containing histidine kinase [Aerococcaceae bacterium NML210727]MCW6654936.1 HAMP domain-containing histidine kinase [Aerococcaceae bacterium NML201296]MCW6662041.1 HAMP domain-containing histidine kinase [Aerococcaceae bacterium NML201209]MCW6680333.1 HAMP domain-containing histidine kinase [Aerococcaceae bacterium NML130460]